MDYWLREQLLSTCILDQRADQFRTWRPMVAATQTSRLIPSKPGFDDSRHRRTLDECARWIDACERRNPGGVFVGFSLYLDPGRMPGPVKRALHGMRALYVWFAMATVRRHTHWVRSSACGASIWPCRTHELTMAMPPTWTSIHEIHSIRRKRTEVTRSVPWRRAQRAWMATTPLRWVIGGPGSTMDMHLEGTLYIAPHLYSPLLSVASMVWWNILVGIWLSFGVLDDDHEHGIDSRQEGGHMNSPMGTGTR